MRSLSSSRVQRRPSPAVQRARGFTLIELVITLGILAVLASAVLPVVQREIQRHKETQLNDALKEIRAAIDAYKLAGDDGRFVRPAQGTGYPANLQVLVDGVEDAHDPNKAKIFFLRRIPRDPMNNEGALANDQTWITRSYASEASDPQSGDDVYDVASRSTRKGLNGIPYAKW
ncbi:general secretion pathway protein GspG (plasmid) [Burkholderia sp. PAMC 26561]|nr:type II secretion system protein [Burkholderia sp. PAMC 26561]AME28734.1 general secretion pathway protein GspG [Burkholderia sp. PAMC 26561]